MTQNPFHRLLLCASLGLVACMPAGTEGDGTPTPTDAHCDMTGFEFDSSDFYAESYRLTDPGGLSDFLELEIIQGNRDRVHDSLYFFVFYTVGASRNPFSLEFDRRGNQDDVSLWISEECQPPSVGGCLREYAPKVGRLEVSEIGEAGSRFSGTITGEFHEMGNDSGQLWEPDGRVWCVDNLSFDVPVVDAL
jgi:hypothetical protein